MLSKRARAFFSVILAITIFNNPAETKQMDTIELEKYRWKPTESAHELYPMQIIEGSFIDPNGYIVAIPSGSIFNNGFGSIGSTYITDDDLLLLPSKLHLTWFSYFEDSFYSGEFNLPTETIAKYFKDGFRDPLSGKNKTYNKIMVGIGLDGQISVFLCGASVHEVAIFQATKTELGWNKVTDNTELSKDNYITEIMKIATSDKDRSAYILDMPPHELWSMYLNKVKWTLRVVGLAKLNQASLSTFNGEYKSYNAEGNVLVIEDRAVPKGVTISWHNPSGENFLTRIAFIEKDIFTAFRKIKSLTPNDVLYLEIEVGNSPNYASVSIRNTKSIVPLDRVRIETFKTKQ